MTNKSVVVRFAPSPTGPLHIGGLRTALFNFLFAKKHRGKFILRIEDTDRNRLVEDAQDHILKSLEWCGITYDEGPIYQSQRFHIYQEFAKKLVEKGCAYYAFDTPEELTEFRKKLQSQGIPNPQYDYVTRTLMKNSLTLPPNKVKKLIDDKVPYVIRIKIPPNVFIEFHDIIRGKVKIFSKNIDDKVLLKADGTPTYHLANVVDDYLMGVTHVIRGEEWLPSTPLHVILYEFLDIKDKMPQFAHLPLILKTEGEGKLSKRDAQVMSIPIYPIKWKDIDGYKEKGFLPIALLNFLLSLGYALPHGKEVLSLDEMIEIFELEKIGKAGTRFTYEKALWFNHHHMQKLSPSNLIAYLKEFQPPELDIPQDKMEHLIHFMKTRAFLLTDFFKHTYLFKSPIYSQEVIQDKDATKINILSAFLEKIKEINDFTPNSIHAVLNDFSNSTSLKKADVFKTIRYAIILTDTGPPLPDIMAFIGKDETIRRIEKFIEVAYK